VLWKGIKCEVCVHAHMYIKLSIAYSTPVKRIYPTNTEKVALLQTLISSTNKCVWCVNEWISGILHI